MDLWEEENSEFSYFAILVQSSNGALLNSIFSIISHVILTRLKVPRSKELILTLFSSSQVRTLTMPSPLLKSLHGSKLPQNKA